MKERLSVRNVVKNKVGKKARIKNLLPNISQAAYLIVIHEKGRDVFGKYQDFFLPRFYF